ncbi:hypothetical protein CC86DRAFT_402277 [Ophiobolus disseminans]|uniref:Uncharacterized protein n=1 Tax=Ophiobolus disseminans TaxID=1469910 RepID=A0A6A7AEP2_9PLEO|nr:hypothetical protein CC86DRAFT_402277 [Ophiobolus disseminans]
MPRSQGAQVSVPLRQLNTPSPGVRTSSNGQQKIRWSAPWHGICRCFSTSWTGVIRCWKQARDSIQKQGGGDVTCPQAETVMLSLLNLLIFFVIAIFAIKYPTVKVKRVVVAINAALASVLGFVFIYDVATATKNARIVKRTLVNTVLTVILTIVILTALYSQLWHRGLNDIVIRLETDNVRSPRFPAVAFFQRQYSTQASIQPGDLKCSSGPRNDHAVQCSSLTIPQALGTVSCDCGDSWVSLESLKRGESTVIWLAKNTTYYPMVPSPSTVSKGAGHFLEIQVFFTYNTTEAFQNSSTVTAPGVWMAIYDPSFSLAQMMADGQLYTAQIDANGHTVVNVGLKYYTYLNRTSNYKYDVTVSTRQNLDLTCDVAKEGWSLCHLTVEMQFTSFLRTIVREERKQEWTVKSGGGRWSLFRLGPVHELDNFGYGMDMIVSRAVFGVEVLFEVKGTSG